MPDPTCAGARMGMLLAILTLVLLAVAAGVAFGGDPYAPEHFWNLLTG